MKKIILFSLFILVAVFGLAGSASAQICDGIPGCGAAENCNCPSCDCVVKYGPGWGCDPIAYPAGDGCYLIPVPVCGNGLCEAGETCVTCADCMIDPVPCQYCNPASPNADLATGCANIDAIADPFCDLDPGFPPQWAETCFHSDCCDIAGGDTCAINPLLPFPYLECTPAAPPACVCDDICDFFPGPENCQNCSCDCGCEDHGDESVCDPDAGGDNLTGCVNPCNHNDICEPGENCVFCGDCMIDPSPCEYCDIALPGRGCAPAPIPPYAEPFATCFHRDSPYFGNPAYDCERVLNIYPWVDWVKTPVCPSGNCEPGENCAPQTLANPLGCPVDCVCRGGWGCNPGAVGADAIGCVSPVPPPPEEIDNPITADTMEALIENIINFIFYFALIFAPFLFIIAGFYFTTAGGDVGRIATAKTIAGWTAAGLITILIAKGLIEMIKSVLGVA